MFSKSSVIFVTINLVRALSIVGICLALSGEILTMANNIQGLKAAINPTTTTPSAPSQTTMVSSTRASNGVIVGRELLSSAVYAASATHALAAAPTASSAVGSTYTTSATTTTSVTSGDSSTSSDQICGYVGNTDIPLQVGGALFSTLSRILCSILLLLCLVAEMPPPTSFTQRFWAYAFPPFGRDFGVGVLGTVQLFVGCVMLSHTATGFPLVAGWFLFSIGFINILFGLAFGHSIKSLRAIFSEGESSEEPGSYYVYNPDVKPPKGQGVGKRGIQISSPMYRA